MTAETGAALEALYLKWKNPPRYLTVVDVTSTGGIDIFREEITDDERAELQRTCKRINEERKQKYDDEVEHLAEEFVNKWREDWLCD